MKITIIGGGLSGLTAGALLSKKGHQVVLIEKNSQLGGRARVLVEKGFLFDMGPSWYMMPELIEDIFQQLGASTIDHFQLKELKTKYRVFSDGMLPVDFFSDLSKNIAVFEKIDSENSKRIAQLLYKTNEVYNLAVNYFLKKPYLNLMSIFDFNLMVNFFKIFLQFNPLQSYHSLVKKHVPNSFLQKIFEFQTVFLGGEPYSTPAIYSILISADFHQKIWYPLGGMTKLVEALEKICLQNKVSIIKNASVTKIIVDDYSKKVVGLNYLKNKKSFHCNTDLIVSSADYPFTELKLLDKENQQYSVDYWQKKELSISSVLIYLGVNKKLKSVKHHNFYFQKNWDNHFSAIKKTDFWPLKPNFYLSVPSVTDHLVAPKNQENLFILIPVSVKTKTKDLNSYVDHVLNHVEEKIGEKFVSNIVYKKVYCQNDFAKDYNAYQGNALGLNHKLAQTLFLRPSMKSSKISGLYYTGQFTQPGVGVPMVMLSGKYVADLIEKDYDCG